jgi:hypothetical protein
VAFLQKDGELAPTQKGASLSQAEWGALVEAFPAINQALDDHDDEFTVQLSTSKRATISTLRCVAFVVFSGVGACAMASTSIRQGQPPQARG